MASISVVCGCGYKPSSGEQVASTAQALATVTTVSVSPPFAATPATVTVQFSATALYSNNKKKKLTTATWSVSDPSVASISATGLVTALKAGSVSVVAKDPASGVSGTATFTVTPAVLTSLAVTPAKKNIAVDAQIALKATGTFSDGTTARLSGSNVIWASTNPAVATVDAGGNVTGVGAGTVAVTATDSVTRLSDKSFITVGTATLASVAVTPAAASLPAGVQQTFLATATYTDGSTLDVTSIANWSSADSTVVTVDAFGTATAVAPGSAKISAGVTGKKGTAKVTVTTATLSSLAITPANKSLPKGKSLQLTATATYSDHTTADITALVTWSSSPAGLFISNDADSAGVATALNVGAATVTAVDPNTGIAATTTVTVTSAVLASLQIAGPPSIQQGLTGQFIATGTFSDSTTRNMTQSVTWTSSVPGVVTVSNDSTSAGVASAVAIGATTISAFDPTSGVASLGSPVTVTPAVLTALEVSPTKQIIPNGFVASFLAIGTFSDGSHTNMTSQVTWSILDGTATISNAAGSQGVVMSNGEGVTHLQALDPSTGISARASLLVAAATVVSVGVTPNSPNAPAGTMQSFRATGVFTDHTTQDITALVTWSSSNTSVADISNAADSVGVATAKAAGSSVISAIYAPNGATGTTTFSVVAAKLASIAITPPSPSVPTGLTQQLVATGMYTDHSTQDLTGTITWSSSAPGVAAVSNAAGTNGVLSAVSPGLATITATDPATGITGSTSASVTLAVLQSIAISPPALSIPAGTNVSLQAIGSYSDGSTKDLTTTVTWSASAEGTINVSNAAFNNGLLNALLPGTGTVTALDPATGIAASSQVTVTQAALTAITVNPRSVSVGKGTTQQFNAIGRYTDGSTRDLTASVTWIATGPGATVSNASDSYGLASAIAIGSADISAIDPATGVRGSASMITTPALLAAIQILPAAPSVLLGGTTQLHATGQYTDGTSADLTSALTWTSSGAALSVSNATGSAGLATGLATGAVTITATDPSSGIAQSVTATVAAALAPAAISAGYYHTCTVRSDHGIDCWGANLDGDLGMGTLSENSLIPAKVPGLTNVSAVSMGGFHSCVLLLDGTVDCWGDGLEIGGSTVSTVATPTPVAGLSGVVSITSSGTHSCALLSSGGVSCWGRNDAGALGNGTTTASSTPVAVTNLAGATAVAAGDDFSCALLSNGTVECWGYDGSGQLGNDTAMTLSPLPALVSRISTAVAIAAGAQHACALLSNGTIECWGSNAFGQLGDGTNQSSLFPVPVSGLSNATAVVAGYAHSCAILSGGAVSCWGYNGNGGLGDNTFTTSSRPVAVSGLASVVALTAGAYHTCALQPGGTRKCWGYDADGELGDGAQDDEGLPVQTAAPIALAGAFLSNCALLSNGHVDCWGDNGYGTLGNGTTTQSNVATPVSHLFNVRAITSNTFTPCALSGSAGSTTAYCWGFNGDGELGNGTTTNSSVPVPINLPSESSISSGGQHTCASLTSGAVYCWGANPYFQLGNTSPAPLLHPTQVSLLPFISAVSAGGIHTCALSTSGSVYCWGYNAFGQLGAGTTSGPIATPQQVHLSGAIAISAGSAHTCALISNGSVECWGQNSNGELGFGSSAQYSAQPQFAALPGPAAAISASGYHTCAKLQSGAVYCWGDNHFSELGDGTTTNSTVPLLLPNASNVTAMAAGGNQSCVIVNGAVQCLGWNANGQLGNGTTTSSKSLTTVLW